MRFTGREFVGRRLEIDGNIYDRCKFRDCDLLFSAKDPIHLVDCTFKDCRLHFEGPAELTLSALRDLYQTGFADLIDRTLENVRRKRPGSKSA
jgi:hypothetical protein